MIVLPSISQVAYTIDNNRYTCYTNDENRSIAIIMFEGERCEALLELSSTQIQELSIGNSRLQAINNINNKTILDLSYNLEECIDIGNEYKSLYTETDKRLNRRTNIMIGSLILNVILITIIVI